MKLVKWFLVCMLGLFLIGFSGCGKDDENDNFDYTDGSAGYIASEIVAMNSAIDSICGAATLYKAADSSPDSIEVITTPWHLDLSINAFIRQATATYPAGSRTRSDTAWFYDADSVLIVNSLNLATISYFRHVRHTNTIYLGDTINIDFQMNVELVKNGPDTLIIRNGTIDGEFNTSTRTITDVTWRREGGIWNEFPESGTVNIDRPLVTIEVEFIGGNSATVTVTRKTSGVSRTFTVNLITGAETE